MPEPLRICRDEDCPICDFPETHYEMASEGIYPVAIGCSHCGWRQEIPSPFPEVSDAQP